MQHGELRTDRCPWFVDELFKHSHTYISDILTAGSRHSCTASRINKKWEHEWQRKSTAEIKNPSKNEDNERVRWNPLRDLPEWLEEFVENLVADSAPEHRDAPASSSREPFLEPRGKVVLGKHNI